MLFIYSRLILVNLISCIENGAEFTMRGIPYSEHKDKKKCLTRFQVDLFRKYAPVQRLLFPIPAILRTIFIKFSQGRFVISTPSQGENQGELSDTVYDSKPGNFGGVVTW